MTLIHVDPTGGFFNQLIETEAIYGDVDSTRADTQHAFGAYLLFLFALRLAAAPAVAAVRETSVLFAAVLAAVFLRERVTPPRLAGSAAVAGGVALLALS